MFNSGGLIDPPHPHKQETRGLDTIQATSFSPWWQLFFQDNFEAKGYLWKRNPEIRKNPKKTQKENTMRVLVEERKILRQAMLASVSTLLRWATNDIT